MSSHFANRIHGPENVRIHPGINNIWHRYRLHDGDMYIDPNCGYVAPLLLRARKQPLNQLAVSFPELGTGMRGSVFAAGELAIKRFFTDKHPNTTGIKAVAANLALASALELSHPSIGDFKLRGCMPRGYFSPNSLVAHPTWIMDRIAGENAQEMFSPPQEATELTQRTREKLCHSALREFGIDHTQIALDIKNENLMIDPLSHTLTVIDVMARW